MSTNSEPDMEQPQTTEEAIFDAARQIGDPQEQAAYLDRACGPDQELRARIERLLRAGGRARAFFQRHGPPAELLGNQAVGGVGEGVGSVIGRYKLLKQIGEGGMGVVYLAEQEEPVRRRVALKIIKLGMDTRQVVARFEAERQALALMDHPNIAKILDAGVTAPTDSPLPTPASDGRGVGGEGSPGSPRPSDGRGAGGEGSLGSPRPSDGRGVGGEGSASLSTLHYPLSTHYGRPYFVMELVQGVPITDFCDKKQLSTEQRLKLFIPVCQAIQSAHQKGIIHRDLKPTNILVSLNPDGSGLPKVIDFGVAKATGQKLTEKTLFTQHGIMIGTPAYMSPEQAEMSNLDVDTRADIYSLGALLYDLLTGGPPFPEERLRSAGYNQMQRILLEEQPERPSTRLRKTSATAPRSPLSTISPHLSTDLDWIVMKCLEKDRARRYETANGLARDLERHLNNEPIVARPPSRLYELQKTVRRHWVGFAAVTAVLLALTIGVVVSRLEAKHARRAEQDQIRLRAGEATQRQRAEASELRGEWLSYAGKMNLVQAAWEQDRIAQVRELLEETASYPDRGFEWYYWQRQTHLALKTLRGHLGGVGSVAWSPDGTRVATAGEDQTVIVWDADTGRQLFPLKGHLNQVDTVGFSRDGRRIVSSGKDHTARIWDAQSGKELLQLKGHTGGVQDTCFSPDGQHVVTGSSDGTARIWDAVTGNTLLTLKGHVEPIHAVAYSPDGLRVVTGGYDRTARVWDALTGHELFSLRGHSNAVSSVAYSPDGQWIATGGDNPDPTARVWDAASGSQLFTLAGRGSANGDVSFSPDSRRIVTASSDHTAGVWDAATGDLLFTLVGHTGPVNDAAFSPDGTRIVTGSSDRTARIWDGRSDRRVLTLNGHSNAVGAAAFSHDGRRIVTGSWDNTAKVWDAITGEVLVTLQGQHSLPLRSVAFSPDGRRIVTGSQDTTAKVWEAASGQVLFTLARLSGPVTRVAFSPNGQRIATGCADTTVKVWESTNGGLLLTLTNHTEGITDLAFSADSRLLATASADETAKIWDAATGSELFELKDTNGIVAGVAFSPDGRQLATTYVDGTAKLWDAASRRLLLTLRGHTDLVHGAAFSPDGRRIVTGSDDHTAKVWDTASGEEVLTLRGHDGNVNSVAFSSDRQRIVTSSNDGTAKVWEAVSAEQVTQWQTEERNDAEREAAAGLRFGHPQLPWAGEHAAGERQARAASVRDPGAIKQWLSLGSFGYKGHDGASGLAQEQVAGEATLHPLAGDRIEGGDLVWRPIQSHDYVVEFHKVYRTDLHWTVAYLVSYIQSDLDQPDLVMKVGSENQSKVYLNGKEVYRCEDARKYLPDQDSVTTGVELNKGINVIVFKVVNEEDFPRASLRFTYASGQPLKGIRVTLTPP